MELHHQHFSDYPVTQWSAGETTQAAIWPRNADFSKRDFLFRVSSATVCEETSDFTIFADYDRYICTLEGSIRLWHEGDPQVYELSPYELHHFDGAVHTRSQGKCRDYNLMLRKGKAQAQVQIASAGETLSADSGLVLLFAPTGGTLRINGRDHLLHSFDSLFVENFSSFQAEILEGKNLIFQNIHLTEEAKS